MKPAENFLGQPIRSLQTMLRVISEKSDVVPALIPDGIYGRDTGTSVSIFQRSSGIPATGITNEKTWNTVVAFYEKAKTDAAASFLLELILPQSQIIRKGTSHPNVYIAQAILTVLSQLWKSITPPAMSGNLDLATSESLVTFQNLNRIDATGELDNETWKALTAQYPLAVNTLFYQSNSQSL